MQNQFGWTKFNLLYMFIFIGIIVSPAMANYQSQEGRWMQQEKLGMMPESKIFYPSDQYSDSLNAYQAFNFNPQIYFDFMGLTWLVDRSGGQVATAMVVIYPDTAEALAKEIGLDANEFRKWIELSDSPIKTEMGFKTLEELSSDHKICPMQKVTVPNTVMAYWGGWGQGVGKHFVDWGKDVATLVKRGFFVYEPEGYDASRFEEAIKFMQLSKKLHGIYAWGHGSKEEFVTVESEIKNQLYFTQYSDWHPIYKLGLGVVWACHSGEGGLNKFTSSNGITKGHVGILYAPLLPFHTYGPTMDQIIQPGIQGTRR